MTTPMPLFPLGAVLFPGLVMPLHVFEERYRVLVRHLMALPSDAPREFGVVAIERGWEVDGDAISATSPQVILYPVGCTAEVRKITEYSDGRFDLVTVGRRRFEITAMVTASTPYLQAEIRYLPESTGTDDLGELAARVLAVFRIYLGLIRGGGGSDDEANESPEVAEQLPEDPQVLSHLVAATASLTVADRQELLAAPDTAQRLRAELGLLHREVSLLRQVRAVPVGLSELPVRPGPN